MLKSANRLVPLAATVAVVGLVTPAAAQKGADFYKGKTVTYIVATAPGGGYDFYGRLVADFMQKHLPGSTFVVRNMPGAGHMIGCNYIFNSKPDGLTIGTYNTGLIYAQLSNQKGVRFDLNKMSWIGKAASESRVLVVGTKSPIQNFNDLLTSKTELKFATSGVGSANYSEVSMIAKAAGLPIKLITGYNGNADQLAMRRGEVTGGLGSRSSYEQFVKDGHGRFIVQVGGKETDVPKLREVLKTDLGKRIAALIGSQSEIFRLTSGPPGIPADRLEALRAAYKAALTDKDLVAKINTGDRPYDPAYGDDVGKLVKEALDQSPEAISLLTTVLEEGKDIKIPTFTGEVSALENGARTVKMKLDGGTEFEAKVSGSRTSIKVAGKDAKRSELKVGQKCTITSPRSGAEAQLIDCK
ncbi:MAG: hypothetical protein RLZ98_1350 [Pseudomonadota bacterium]|jgi:tripartite-type tricarboxylate transporter receptor subunit TctC